MKKNAMKLLALALALMLVFSGCGSSQEDVGGNVVSNETVSQTIPGGNVEQPTTIPVEETAAPETTAPAEENPLSLGRMEGGVYTNEYVGYTCELDENWTFYSAEELQQIPSNVADMMEGSELGDALEGVQQFTDMMAENVNDLTTMNVLYQKLSMQERLAYAVLTEEDIIDATLEQKDMIVEAYEAAGMTVISMEKTTVTFMGEKRTAIKGEFTVQDVPYYTLQLFDYHLGEYSVTTTLASYIENNTASLLDLFQPLG